MTIHELLYVAIFLLLCGLLSAVVSKLPTEGRKPLDNEDGITEACEPADA